MFLAHKTARNCEINVTHVTETATTDDVKRDIVLTSLYSVTIMLILFHIWLTVYFLRNDSPFLKIKVHLK